MSNFLTHQEVLTGSSYRISTDNDELFSFCVFYTVYLFYWILVFTASLILSASSFASFFNPTKEAGKPGRTRMDPDHSLLLPYRISDVEVFDYQLAGLRTEFIWPSFWKYIAQKNLLLKIFFAIHCKSNMARKLSQLILHLFSLSIISVKGR